MAKGSNFDDLARDAAQRIEAAVARALGILGLRVEDSEGLDAALTELAALEPRMAQVVELRYFIGLSVAEVAAMLELEERTVYRDWAAARAWLKDRLGD